MQLLASRVHAEMATRRRRRAVYALFALCLTMGEIVCSTLAAFLVATDEHLEVAGVLSLVTTTLLTFDSALKIREHASWHHAAFLSLKKIHSSLAREARHMPTHPLQHDFDDLMADVPIDLLTSATELCCPPPLPAPV